MWPRKYASFLQYSPNLHLNILRYGLYIVCTVGMKPVRICWWRFCFHLTAHEQMDIRWFKQII